MDSYTMNRIMDEILGSIRQKRSAGTHRGVYWIPQSQLDEERKHKYALELEGQKSAGELERQRLINTGNVDVQGVRNIGELARQRLMNEGNLAQENVRGKFGVQGEEIRAGAQKYGADQTLAGHKYTADQSLASHKYTADQLLKGHEITSAGHVEVARLGAEGKRPTPSEIYLQSAGQFYDPAIYDSLRKREIGPPPIPEGDITAGTPQTATPAAAPPPARTTLGDTVTKPEPTTALPKPKPPEEASNITGLGWGNLQRSPGYLKYQEELKRKKAEADAQRLAEGKAWNERLRNEALSRRKRAYEAPSDFFKW